MLALQASLNQGVKVKDFYTVPSLSWTLWPLQSSDSQELPDVAPVDTHGGDFGAAVLVEFVATRLASEAMQEKLLAYVTEGQFQKRLPYLWRKQSDNTVYSFWLNNK